MAILNLLEAELACFWKDCERKIVFCPWLNHCPRVHIYWGCFSGHLAVHPRSNDLSPLHCGIEVSRTEFFPRTFVLALNQSVRRFADQARRIRVSIPSVSLLEPAQQVGCDSETRIIALVSHEDGLGASLSQP